MIMSCNGCVDCVIVMFQGERGAPGDDGLPGKDGRTGPMGPQVHLLLVAMCQKEIFMDAGGGVEGWKYCLH